MPLNSSMNGECTVDPAYIAVTFDGVFCWEKKNIFCTRSLLLKLIILYKISFQSYNNQIGRTVISDVPKAPCRSNYASRVLKYISCLSFPKALWSIVTFFVALQKFGSKAYEINIRNSPGRGWVGKHVRGLPPHSFAARLTSRKPKKGPVFHVDVGQT